MFDTVGTGFGPNLASVHAEKLFERGPSRKTVSSIVRSLSSREKALSVDFERPLYGSQIITSVGRSWPMTPVGKKSSQVEPAN